MVKQHPVLNSTNMCLALTLLLAVHTDEMWSLPLMSLPSRQAIVLEVLVIHEKQKELHRKGQGGTETQQVGHPWRFVWVAGHGSAWVRSLWEDCKGPCTPAKHWGLQCSDLCLKKHSLRLSFPLTWPHPAHLVTFPVPIHLPWAGKRRLFHRGRGKLLSKGQKFLHCKQDCGFWLCLS